MNAEKLTYLVSKYIVSCDDDFVLEHLIPLIIDIASCSQTTFFHFSFPPPQRKTEKSGLAMQDSHQRCSYIRALHFCCIGLFLWAKCSVAVIKIGFLAYLTLGLWTSYYCWASSIGFQALASRHLCLEIEISINSISISIWIYKTKNKQ